MSAKFCQFVLVLAALAAAPAFAKGTKKHCESLVNPGNQKTVEKGQFNEERDLIDYIVEMHKDFRKDIGNLRSTDIILDGGAGRALMLIGYLYDEEVDYVHPVKLPAVDKRAKAVAVGFKRPRPSRVDDHDNKARADKDPRFEYIEGDIGKIFKTHPKLKGVVKIITDFHGVMQYSHLQKTLEIYLRLLKKGGKIYFSNPNAVIMKNGKPVSIVQYLSAIKGAKFQYTKGSYIGKYTAEQNSTELVLTKTSDNFVVPDLEYQNSDSMDDVTGVEAQYNWI